MREESPSQGETDARLRAVEETIRQSAGRYAARFGVMRLREEIEAESVARVLGLIAEERGPFGEALSDPDAVDRMQRFAHGLVANVAREALRGRVRHAHVSLEGRAEACGALRVGSASPEGALELEETIGEALCRFRSLGTDVRETIVAEEVLQNGYASGEAGRLCRSCEVSFQRVWQMIENRRNGVWSAEAWRQRVHRSRKKARAAIGGASPFALVAALVLGVFFSLGAAGDTSRTEVPRAVRVADDGSTQNGKAPHLLASTQNGKAKGKGSA